MPAGPLFYLSTPVHMSNRVDLVCIQCGTSFSKPRNEYNRALREGQLNFCCSRKCGADRGRPHVPPPVGRPDHLKPDNRRDELSPFRWFLKRLPYRTSARDQPHDFDAGYLKLLWETQNGTCPLTGCLMLLPKSTAGFKKRNPINASLDRINPSKGYLRGNVRFITVIANYAKHTFSDADVIEFCKAVSVYSSTK